MNVPVLPHPAGPAPARCANKLGGTEGTCGAGSCSEHPLLPAGSRAGLGAGTACRAVSVPSLSHTLQGCPLTVLTKSSFCYPPCSFCRLLFPLELSTHPGCPCRPSGMVKNQTGTQMCSASAQPEQPEVRDEGALGWQGAFAALPSWDCARLKEQWELFTPSQAPNPNLPGHGEGEAAPGSAWSKAKGPKPQLAVTGSPPCHPSSEGWWHLGWLGIPREQ